ncbi:MAG TPA: toll/interleukin-1 receptor domain-containing protein [Solirubrobacterales bacterium]|nr:toll/interleukin-1 receptor domain-containing protein [Solirubrobacterales bacterium]
MKVFVSWSGPKSRDVAGVLRDWLPSVLHAVEPFVSARDIRAGTRWQAEIAGELDDTDFGLICVTKENQAAEWLNFEAGALAKSVDSSRVVPIAIDLVPAEIATPLGQFQAIRLSKEDLPDLLTSMNECSSSPIAEGNVRRSLDKWWPDLETALREIGEKTYGPSPQSNEPVRSDRDLLVEVLDSVRTLGRSPSSGRRAASDPVNDLINRAVTRLDFDRWGLRTPRPDRRILEVPGDPGADFFDLLKHIHDWYGVDVDVVALVAAEDES